MMGDVKTFFNAKTFAVIGASRDDKKVGHAVFKNLLHSDKKIFPVNPKAKEILGYKSYEDILEIPYQIDCIVIAVPAKLIPLVLRQAQKRKIKSAIILSAGFSEIGETELEQRILEIANEADITILGPNSYGIIDPIQKLNTTYFEGKTDQGSMAFISQSGAIGSAVLDTDAKLSGFVSVGNSIQLDFSDFIEYYSNDKNTKIITLYLESLKKGKGKHFIEICKRCKKPIIVLKSGKSQAGQKVAQSHTAALASEAGVYEGILKQAGCIQVDSIKQLFDIAKILEKYPKIGNKAAIITNAGGLGVLTTDACETSKIKVPSLEESTIKKLDRILQPNWSHNNPIDLIGDARVEDYEKTLQLIEKENFDFSIILLTPQRMTESLATAKVLIKSKKPIFACFLGDKQIKEAKQFMDRLGIINFNDPKEMCETIGKLI
jgi:acyl-CoA synthetase (NDP forming)